MLSVESVYDVDSDSVMAPFALCVFISCLLLVSVDFVKGSDSPCWAMNGRCQYTSEPCGHYKAGYCSGPANRQCCVVGADIRCHRRYSSGVCLYTSSRCRGGFDGANLCGGGNNRQCCRRV